MQYFSKRNGKEWLITILCKKTLGCTSWISHVNINLLIKIVAQDRQFHIWASEIIKILHQNALILNIGDGWFFLAEVFPSTWTRQHLYLDKHQPLLTLSVPSLSVWHFIFFLSYPVLKAILFLFLVLYPIFFIFSFEKWKYEKYENILQKFRCSHILFRVI